MNFHQNKIMKQCLNCNLKSEDNSLFYNEQILECQKCGSFLVAYCINYILMPTAHRYKRGTKEAPFSKDFAKEQFIKYFIENGIPSLFVHGDAIGGDTICKEVCEEFFIPTKPVKPDYKKYHPKRAPLARNEDMVNMSNRLIAFWDGIKAGGTWQTIKYARERIDTYIVEL